ncbi:MAG: class I SAM-dependent methyltransferase [Acidimicrobiales bacterium]|jgi:SAM-dependent methyltransferase
MADLEGRGPLPGTLTRQQGAPGLDFDAAYEGTPPWDIGAPQPDLVELVEGEALKGRVLDVGCGTGEHALLAAERGFEATGIDASPKVIAIAREKASARGLAVRFLVGDALDPGSLGEQFDTVIDSGLFHVFDDEQRARYVESLRAATALGGRLLLLCFSDRQPGELGPRRVTKKELRVSFADGWRVHSIDEARMILTFAPDGAFAWCALMTRVN